jgi:hypothetical protein
MNANMDLTLTTVNDRFRNFANLSACLCEALWRSKAALLCRPRALKLQVPPPEASAAEGGWRKRLREGDVGRPACGSRHEHLTRTHVNTSKT